jgi:hypothetical protein
LLLERVDSRPRSGLA